jgi:hypothetical protein
MLQHREIENLKLDGSAGFHMGIKRGKKMPLATVAQAEQLACFLYHYARVAASPFPILSNDQ